MPKDDKQIPHTHTQNAIWRDNETSTGGLRQFKSSPHNDAETVTIILVQCGTPKMAKLVYNPNKYIWFMILTTI